MKLQLPAAGLVSSFLSRVTKGDYGIVAAVLEAKDAEYARKSKQQNDAPNSSNSKNKIKNNKVVAGAWANDTEAGVCDKDGWTPVHLGR
jgi:hypothetical protein